MLAEYRPVNVVVAGHKSNVRFRNGQSVAYAKDRFGCEFYFDRLSQVTNVTGQNKVIDGLVEGLCEGFEGDGVVVV